MRYYITWTDRDVIYHYYDNDCYMMLSPRNVHKGWSSEKWDFFPKKLIVDSGAIQYIKEKRIPSPEEVLETQINIFKGLVPDNVITLCSPDIPLIPHSISKTESLDRIKNTLINAEKYFNLVSKREFDFKFDILGVVQSFNSETAYYSARRLLDIGYQKFGIGSLIPLSIKGDKKEIYRIVEAVLEAVGNRVHVFGITSPSLIAKLKLLGVESIDSSTPMREAFNGSINYSRPFRRFKVIDNIKSQEWSRNYSYSSPLEKLEDCLCPVCIEDKNRLLLGGTKNNINWKAIHNYFHLKWEVESV